MNHVNSDGSGSHAYYSIGMWTILAAMILLFFGMFIVLFTCFSARKAKKRNTYKNEPTYGDGVGGYNETTAYTPKKKFGVF